MKLPTIAAGMAALACCTAAQAFVVTPQVTALRINSNGDVLFNVNGGEAAACATNQEFRWVVPGTAPVEERDFVVTAFIEGYYIDTLAGTGECKGTSEILRALTTGNGL